MQEALHSRSRAWTAPETLQTFLTVCKSRSGSHSTFKDVKNACRHLDSDALTTEPVVSNLSFI